tara:strand:- start:577 stop:1275 length:699 start_codon:yes stop_codon:yes gene_type:complete
MKKLLVVFLTSIMLTSTAAFAGSISVGTKVSNAFIDASGTETTTAGSVTGGAINTNTTEVDNMAIIPSIYVEYSLDSSVWGSEGNEITLGANYTFGEADVSDQVSTRTESAEDAAGSGSSGSVTYGAQASVENYVNYYLEIPVAGALFAKVGFSQIDVITEEDADHEGSYGNATLDGENFGMGIKGVSGNISWKAAYEVTNWDSLALTSTTSNKIAADLDVAELALSVGYRF